MSIEQDLVALKTKSEKLTALRIETATKLQGLEEEKNKLIAEAAALGIAPEKIEETLKAEEAAIQEAVAKLDAEITRVLGEVSVL